MSFVRPLQHLVATESSTVVTLLKSLIWFFELYGPMVLFALIAVYAIGDQDRKRELVTLQLIAWIVVSTAVILPQKLSWWIYQFMLWFVPVGTLALRGVDVLITRLARSVPSISARALAATVAFLVFPTLAPGLVAWAKNAAHFAHEIQSSPKTLSGGRSLTHLYRQGKDKLGRPVWSGTAYETVLRETAFLSEPDALPGPIFVFGDPTTLMLSGRTQPPPITGWQTFLPSDWRVVTRQIATARPVYIFVSSGRADMISQRSPETRAVIEKHYEVLKTSELGVWYRVVSPNGKR